MNDMTRHLSRADSMTDLEYRIKGWNERERKSFNHPPFI